MSEQLSKSDLLNDVAWSFGYECAKVIINRRKWPQVPDFQANHKLIRWETLRLLRKWIPSMNRAQRRRLGRRIAETIQQYKNDKA